MTTPNLDHRFAYHAPSSGEIARKHESVRHVLGFAAEVLDRTTPDCRLAYTVLPDGQTVGRWLAPQLDDVYEHGTMPSLLPALGPGA